MGWQEGRLRANTQTAMDAQNDSTHALTTYEPDQDIGKRCHDPRPTPNGKGYYVTHEKGSVHWTPDHGYVITVGEIRLAWSKMKWENGPLGFPKSNERPISRNELSKLLSGICEAPDQHFITRYGRCSEFEGGNIYFWVDPDDRNIITILLKDGERFDEVVSFSDRHSTGASDPFNATIRIIREGKRMGLSEIDVAITAEGARRLQGALSVAGYFEITGSGEETSDNKVILRIRYK